MSTYLYSLVISKYVSSNVTQFVSDFKDDLQSKPFRTWAPDKIWKQNKQSQLSQIAGPKIIESYTKLLGVGYALPKIDQIGVLWFPTDALENWGLIIYK